MLDLASVPVVDNHCHPIDPLKAHLDADRLAREFYHGIGDLPEPGVVARRWGASADLRRHYTSLGVVQSMVSRLSRLLGCSPDIHAVADERNRRTSEGFAEYAQLLYQDAGIVATILDSDLQVDHPSLCLVPGRVMRLFQMGPVLKRLLAECESYNELLLRYQEALHQAVRRDCFVGVKSHLAEEAGLAVEPIWADEANGIFAAAKKGNVTACKSLYVAVFTATLLEVQELDVPVHLHTGFTGVLWDGSVLDADPFLLVPFLRLPEFVKTRIVLLHGAYPWIQHAAAVAHAFPHVWVDLSWTTPWISLRMTECFRDAMGVAPLSKLMIGSGGHGTPEIAWLSAVSAKVALNQVLSEAVQLGHITTSQAEHVGRMVLHDNAAELYNLH